MQNLTYRFIITFVSWNKWPIASKFICKCYKCVRNIRNQLQTMQIEKGNEIISTTIPLEDAFASPASPEMAGTPLSPGKELLSVITSGALS